MTKNRMITSAMAAEILGYSASYIRRLLKASKLKGERLGHDWLISMMEVNRFKLKREKKREEFITKEKEI